MSESRMAAVFDSVLLPVLALAGAVLLFGGFVWLGGTSPTETWLLLFKGAFGDAFSWQNTLQRAAPLMLTALCVAIPQRAGLMVIGGEGALVLGNAPRDRWPEDRLIFVSNVPDPNGLSTAQDFVKNYNAIPIDGTHAGPIALQTYDALNLVFAALARAERIDRGGVQAALRQIDFSGLGARYAFDQQGNLIDPQTHVFEYDKDRKPQLIP